MRSIRSGAPSRFLIFTSPEFWAPRSELFVFNFLFGFLPLLGAIWGFSYLGLGALRTLADPAGPRARLTQTADTPEARLGGVLRGGPLCVITHETYRDKSWREDFRAVIGEAHLETPAGAAAIDWPRARWAPELFMPETKRGGELYNLVLRERREKLPMGGRLRERCLNEGDRLFIDGCWVDGPTVTPALGACGRMPLVLTLGDGTPRPRLAEIAASLSGRAAALGAALLLALLYLWRVLGARPLADALARRLRRPSLPLVEPVGLFFAPILAPSLLLFGLWLPARIGSDAVEIDRYAYAGALCVIICALGLAARMLDRRRALRGIIDVVRGGAAPALDRAREGEPVALDAEVDPQAEISPAPLSHDLRAHWLVSVTAVYRSGNNHSSAPLAEHRGPMVVPIVADGRRALLDLTNATVDLRAVRVRRGGKGLRPEQAALAGEKRHPDNIYLFEERYLDPREPLHVIGRVIRFEARGGVIIPVIGGVPGDLAAVHAGSRRTLLRGLAVERGYLSAAIAIAIGIAGAVVSLTGYLLAR